MAVELRPLTLPELLDRAFSAYRQHLALFVGIMAVPSVFAMAGTLLLQLFQSKIRPGTPPEQVMKVMVPLFVAAMITTFIYLIAYMFACGATSLAVSDLYKGGRPTVKSAYGALRGRVVRLLLLFLWTLLRVVAIGAVLTVLIGVVSAFSALISRLLAPFVMLAGMGVAFGVVTWIFVRYGVAIPAVVLEERTAGKSLRRSVELTEGYRWRVFLLMVCAVVITYAGSAIFQGPFMAGAWLAGPGTTTAFWLTVMGAVLGAVAGMFSGPIMIIGLALVYFDLRIRKEALDLDLMLDDIDRKAPPIPAPPVVQA